MADMKDKRKHVKFVCSPIVNTPKPAKEEKKDDDAVDAAAAADGIDTEGGNTEGGNTEGEAAGEAGEKKDDMDVEEPEVDLSGNSKEVDGEGDTTMEDA